MMLEIGLIVAGIPLGYMVRQKALAQTIVNNALSLVIYIMLFLIGVSLGGNDDLLARIAELGVQGALIGIGCALGSAVVVWATYRFIFKANI